MSGYGFLTIALFAAARHLGKYKKTILASTHKACMYLNVYNRPCIKIGYFMV